jgi:hypothetical protein
MLSVFCALCHMQALYAQFHYAECRYPEGRGAQEPTLECSNGKAPLGQALALFANIRHGCKGLKGKQKRFTR